MKLAQQARVKRIALTHHDPLRDDDELDRLLAGVRARLREAGSSLDVFAAAEGQSVEVASSRAAGRLPDNEEFQAKTPVGPALMDKSVLLRIADAETAATLSEAVRAEGIHATFLSDVDEVRKLIAEHRLALAIIEHDLPQIDGVAACRAIRQQETDGEQLPLVMVAAREDRAAGDPAGVTDWLIKPFSVAYARTKIRAWILRTACRWIRGSIPENERQRLASLRALQLLDTEPEDRFDRITRLARALLHAPIAAISLIDESRQWLKSCYGLSAKESSRDAAFCAHVVYDCEPLIVPDALLDERFADNPFVVNEPRVRFYAGYPLVLNDGTCVGTLCVLDTRPRFLEGADIAGLRDLADLAVREILLPARASVRE